MMIPVGTVAIVLSLYIALLFGVACYAEKKRDAGHSITANSLVYSLSIGVLYTSYTCRHLFISTSPYPKM